MAEPPSPKRQRLSEPDATRSQPTTPTRASYQSPTKASLARSHPTLLARSPGRDRTSETYSKGRSLRMSLLANRTISLDAEADTFTPAAQSSKPGENITTQVPVTIASDGKEGFSAAIARAFAEDRPRHSIPGRSPLESRQPSAAHPLHNTARLSPPVKSASPSFMRPTLVPSPLPSRSSIRHASSEPDLPPTPMQLGLEPPAERPRGLIASSSSPGGSKSNSGRRRRRRRHQDNLHATSTPSKLREQVQKENPVPIGPASMLQPELPAEAPESDSRQPEVGDEQDALPESIKEKQVQWKSLQAELSKLKDDIRRLELMAAEESRDITPRTLKALTSLNVSARSGSPDIVLPEMITMPANPLPYLTLFAPASLRIKTLTRTVNTGTELRQIHTIKVNAPPPYPPHLFGAKIEVNVDPRTTQIEVVELVRWNGSTTGASHATLRKWAEARLLSQMHSKDVSGLVWGMGSYWEFCERRARIWNALMGAKLSDEDSKPEELVRWLGRQSISVPVDEKGVSIALTWTARLDWTGRVEESIGIACKGVPARAHQMVVRVFEGLRRKKGILKAVEGVVTVLQDT